MDPQQQWHTQRMVIGGPAGGSGLSGNAPTEVLKETLARLEECHKAVMIIVGKLGIERDKPLNFLLDEDRIDARIHAAASNGLLR